MISQNVLHLGTSYTIYRFPETTQKKNRSYLDWGEERDMEEKEKRKEAVETNVVRSGLYKMKNK